MLRYFFVIVLAFFTASCTTVPLSVSATTPGVTPSETPASTMTPSPSLTPPPEYDPYITSIDSPDGKFTAKMYVNWNDLNEKPAIEIWNKSGQVLWKVAYQYDWDPDRAPNDSMRIYGWSGDSTKVYFYYSFAYDGWYTLFNGSSLQSMDAHTGEVKDIIPGCCIAFAFSPDMDKIAYTENGKAGILDLAGGTGSDVDILPHSYEQAGWIFISPSEEKVIFHTLSEYDGKAIVLDTKTMEQKIIIDQFFIESLRFDGWTSDEDPRYVELGKDVFTIDLKTLSKQTLGTPTAQP